MFARLPLRGSLAAVLLATLAVSDSPAAAPKDLGARTFVGEVGEFKLLLTWNPRAQRRVTLHTTRPGSVPVLMCVVEDSKLKALPKKVSCDYGREFSLTKKKSGYSLSIGKELVKELSFGREEPAPTVFKLSAVNPFELTAPGSGPYGVSRGSGNRSSETAHLPSPKAARIPSAEEVSAWVRTAGFEPTGVPMENAESLWRRFDQAAEDGLLMQLPESERRGRYLEILQSELDDL